MVLLLLWEQGRTSFASSFEVVLEMSFELGQRGRVHRAGSTHYFYSRGHDYVRGYYADIGVFRCLVCRRLGVLVEHVMFSRVKHLPHVVSMWYEHKRTRPRVRCYIDRSSHPRVFRKWGLMNLESVYVTDVREKDQTRYFSVPIRKYRNTRALPLTMLEPGEWPEPGQFFLRLAREYDDGGHVVGYLEDGSALRWVRWSAIRPVAFSLMAAVRECLHDLYSVQKS